MQEDEFLGEENVGYRTPGGFDGAAAEGVGADAGNEDEGGGDELTPEDLVSMGEEGLEELAKELNIEGLSGEELRLKIAEELGFETEEVEGGEGEEKGEELPAELRKRQAELDKRYAKKFEEFGALRAKAHVLDVIESDPARFIPELAKRYGVELRTDTSKSREPKELRFEKLETKQDEDLPSYINRSIAHAMKTMFASLKEELAATKEESREPARTADPREAAVNRYIQHLSEKHPDWGLYADEIIQLVQADPKKANDPTALYQEGKRLALGIREASKTKKIKVKAKTGKKISRTGERPSKPQRVGQRKLMNFDEAWEKAKERAGRR